MSAPLDDDNPRQRPAGPILDDLGVTIGMDESDRVAEVLVVAKTVSMNTGDVALVISSNDLDWVAQWGLHAAAGHVFARPDVLRCRGEEDFD